MFSPSFVVAFTDKLGSAQSLLASVLASTDDSALWPSGSVQSEIDGAAALLGTGGDRAAQQALLPTFDLLAAAVALEPIAKLMVPAFKAVDAYCKAKGATVNSSIVSFGTFLTYYNGGGGGAKFSALVSPEFASLWAAAGQTAIPAACVMCPGVHPDLIENGSAYGMGQRAFGGAYVDGDPTDSTEHAEVEPLIEIVVDFADASAFTTIEVLGTDDTGAESTTWTATLRDALNPASAISITTIPAITVTGEKQAVAISDQRGIVPGSVLFVSTGLDDQETIIVEDTDTYTLHPGLNTDVTDAGMGVANIGTAFAGGAPVDADHTEVTPLLEVIDTFVDSSEAPVISVAGIDDTGLKSITGATNATPIVITSVAHGLVTGKVVNIQNVKGNTAANGTWTITKVTDDTFSLDTSVGNAAYTSGGNWYMTWAATLGSSNPVTAVSTTLSAAITATGLQTVAVASATGIIAGSVLRIDAGLSTEEYVSVIAISSTNVTAVFTQLHSSGAAVSSKTTVALTPSVSGRRLKKVVGITITATDATEGGVRVVGKQQQIISAVFKKAHDAGATVTGKRTYALTPSVAGRRLQNVTTIEPLGATGLTAGTVRVVGKRDRVVA